MTRAQKIFPRLYSLTFDDLGGFKKCQDKIEKKGCVYLDVSTFKPGCSESKLALGKSMGGESQLCMARLCGL